MDRRWKERNKSNEDSITSFITGMDYQEFNDSDINGFDDDTVDFLDSFKPDDETDESESLSLIQEEMHDKDTDQNTDTVSSYHDTATSSFQNHDSADDNTDVYGSDESVDDKNHDSGFLSAKNISYIDVSDDEDDLSDISDTGTGDTRISEDQLYSDTDDAIGTDADTSHIVTADEDTDNDTAGDTTHDIHTAAGTGKRRGGTRRLRKDSYSLVILKILNSLGPARRKDLNIFLLSYFSKQTAVRIWHDLENRKFITLYKDRSDQLTAKITDAGRLYLADNAPDQQFLNTWELGNDPDFVSSPSSSIYTRGMTLSTVRIMFMSCDAAVLPEDKPSCADLFMALCPETTKEKIEESIRRAEGLSENDSDTPADSDDDTSRLLAKKEDSRKNKTVYRHCSVTEMKEILEKGIFYSASEFREALKELHYGDSTAIAGSRFYGIWISNDRYYIVYAAVSSRRIRLAKAVESRLVDMVYAFVAEITDFRSMRQLDFHYGKEMGIGRNCIVITIGSGTVKSMATGTVYGKNTYGAVNDFLKDNGVSVKPVPAVPSGFFTSDKTENVSGKKGRPARAQLLLQHHNELFNKVFAVEANNIGATSLMYILKTSPEEYRKQYLHFASVTPFAGKIQLPSEEKTYEFCYYITLNNNGSDKKGTKMRIVYVPCYDINVITDMRIGYHEKGEQFCIITRPELAGIISACVGGKCLFLQELNNRMVMIKDVPVYDKNGFTEKQAESKRKTIERNYAEKLKEEEIREKIRSLKSEKDELRPDQRSERKKINDEIRALKKELPGKTRNRGINVQTIIPLELHTELKQLADEQGNTISYVLRGIIESALADLKKENPSVQEE